MLFRGLLQILIFGINLGSGVGGGGGTKTNNQTNTFCHCVLSDMILMIFLYNNDEHLLTPGDCNVKTFLNIIKQDRLVFKVV